MLSKLIPLLIFLYYCSRYSFCITNGKRVETEKRFVVYLLKAPESTKQYIGWLCGGAIVTHNHIVTSAACVLDVRHIYVIPGYRTYVRIENIDKDECTKRKKRKIIHACMPKSFSRTDMMNKNDTWNWGDIAVATVDTPFNFMDKTYETYCSYTPNAIKINMHKDWQKQQQQVLFYGWGTTKYYRPVNDARDYNEKYLRYGAGILAIEDNCRRKWSDALMKSFKTHFQQVLLCVEQGGELDERGVTTKFSNSFNYCAPESQYKRSRRKTTIKKLKLSNDETQWQIQQKYTPNSLRTELEPVDDDPKLLKVPGICQNDHGGPLTAWKGGKEVLIGVASLFATDDKMQCRGPYGFTSTTCHNKFLTCAIWPDKSIVVNNTRRALCNDPPENTVVERNFSWVDHPDGPAETEYRRSGPLNHGYDRI